MSVTEEELEALRTEVAKARQNDREERAKQAEEVAARTREIKANRLKRELGQGLEGAGEEETPASPPTPRRTSSEPNKSHAVTPPRDDSDTDDKSA